MDIRLMLMPGLFLGLVGCVGGEAPHGPELLVPEDVELRWDDAFNGVGDGRAALVPVDVMAYDGDSGDPLGAVSIDMLAGEGAELLPADAITAVDPDDDLADLEVYDAWEDRYVAIDPDAPSLSRIGTDAWGLARVYVLIDAFPADAEGNGFAPVPVVVSMGETDDTFLLVPR